MKLAASNHLTQGYSDEVASKSAGRTSVWPRGLPLGRLGEPVVSACTTAAGNKFVMPAARR
jgi:hypothetical protein